MSPRHDADEPACRLVVDHPPPLGTRIWLISETGNGCARHWHADSQIVAWAPLPKLTLAQRVRLAKLRATGVDVTQAGAAKQP